MPAHAAGWPAFVVELATGKAMPVTLDDGIAALPLAEAADRSVRTGAAVTLAIALDE